jgi:23S rRNA (adenine2503-C2)-methyltransferase
MPQPSIHIFSKTCEELADVFTQRMGKGAYHARMLYREVFKSGGSSIDEIPELSAAPDVAHRISSNLLLNPDPVAGVLREAGLVKFVTRLKDGLHIESVIIPMATHGTVCISAQVGCRMGCRFCETAQMGLFRNLTVEEIVGQVYSARFVFGESIRNVVFMGMGEPLDNLSTVIQAIRVLSDPRGLDIAMRYITLSTAGLPGGIERLAGCNWPRLNLAVSLNAPNDQIRSKLMPINKKFNMMCLRDTLQRYPLRKKGAFFIEYVLIPGVNDRPGHARQLADYLSPLRVKLNVIPVNPRVRTRFPPATDHALSAFCSRLIKRQLFVRKRSPRGLAVLGACGQLGGGDLSPLLKMPRSGQIGRI